METSEPKKIRHLVEKRQKGHSLFYWQPSAGLKRAGYTTVPLGKDRAVAEQQAEAINRNLDQWRDGQLVVEKNKHGTLPWLIEQYKQDQKYKKLGELTKTKYEYSLRLLLKWSADKGDPPMRTIKRRDAMALWSRYAEEEGKLRKAQYTMGIGSALWNFALRELEDEDVVDKNPFSRLGVDAPPPRQVVWQPGQIAAAIETALVTPAHDKHRRIVGYRKSVALAVLIAVNTAQRPGDIFAMNESQYDGTTITLTQSKTGTTLSIPVTKDLKQAIDDMLAARRAGNVVSLHQQDRPLVMNETRGRRYGVGHFSLLFAEIRDAAGLPNTLQFRDLRRTATVQLAEAGCEIPEIAAMGGWSINTVHQMLKVYCPLNLTMAQNALVKLENYRAAGKLEG